MPFGLGRARKESTPLPPEMIGSGNITGSIKTTGSMGMTIPDRSKEDKRAERDYRRSIEQLRRQAQGVEQAGIQASQMADFFSPERGQYIQGLNQLMTGGQSAIAADPSYQFRFKQGQQALESSLAAGGLLGSGGAALELQQYGQQAASQEFEAQYQRLFNLAGVGRSDPGVAAQLRLQGAQAPLESLTQLAGFGAQSREAGRTRAFEQSQAALSHQQDLQKMQYENQLANKGRRGGIGGGRGGTPLDQETLSTLVPYDFGKMKQVGYGMGIHKERSNIQKRWLGL